MIQANVLIVEDHPLTRFALLTSLKEVDFISNLYEAENALSAYKVLAENKVDIVLMDLGLPVIDGVSCINHIKKEYPDIKIIVVTSHSEEKEIEGCLNAGINAYCSKDIKPEKLTELILDVLEGSIWFDASVSDVILEKTSKLNKKPNKNNKYDLTQKELTVLSLLAEGNSNSEIAKKMNISINTTKVHMCAILQKLSVDDRTQAAIKAIRENLA